MSFESGQRSKNDKFKGDNYDAWAYKVRTKLESKDLWKFVGNEVTLSQTANDHEKTEHFVKLARAKEKIVKALDVSVIELIQNLNTPHEIWEKLAEIYLKKQFGNVVRVLQLY